MAKKPPAEVGIYRYVMRDDVECYLHAGWEIAADLADCYQSVGER
jgi:hypothetical protein